MSGIKYQRSNARDWMHLINTSTRKIYRIQVAILFGIVMLMNACSNNDDQPPEPIDNEPSDEIIQADYNPTPYQLDIPDGIPDPIIPADNPLTKEGIDLGRHLFYDPILSQNESRSCASCHHPDKAFTDGEPFSFGVLGIQGRRNSMALVNLAYNPRGFFWDGRAESLEEQAISPVEDHDELNADWDEVIGRLQVHPDYPKRFREAFGIEKTSDIDQELVIKSIAQFERTLISFNSRFDSIVLQSKGWPSEAEKRGIDLFFIEPNVQTLNHPGCSHCHLQPFFTDNTFRNNGLDSVGNLEDFLDYGHGEFTNNRLDNGRFRVPTLRNIEFTAPYMHDGRFETLEEVIDSYSKGGHGVLNEDPNIQPFTISEQDKQDLIAFLKMLSDTSFLVNPAFANPFE